MQPTAKKATPKPQFQVKVVYDDHGDGLDMAYKILAKEVLKRAKCARQSMPG
ncbi:hypothetical protein [Gelria sp. Kuro-4]|uniref:hypothetical protein n=1 Tax=Gelria sp. Kuro-4 TaxID=2796927 RepID=UPI001BF12A30|nr:hypothetical protein [Gelria sp. Kuro-4]BCV25143.1 hypothetical protein kuro4_19160 [Gelria sp. Kuro-4]